MYLFIFKTPENMLEKVSLKCGFRHDLEVFSLWKQSDSIWRGKKRIHLYEDWHSRQETVKSCRLNPLLCKLLQFLFNFTISMFAASSWNLSICFSNCSLKLQALKSRKDMRVSGSITNKTEVWLMIVKIMLNVKNVQLPGKNTLFCLFLTYDF